MASRPLVAAGVDLVGYAVVRLRSHGPRSLIVALGIAVGAAVLAMSVVSSAAVQDRAVQQALAELAPSDRAVQAIWSGVPAQSSIPFGQLDALARRNVQTILGQKPFGVEVFRQASWGGAFVNLGAVDGLAKWIDVTDGRPPRPCTPRHCELIQIGGKPAAPNLPFLKVVGRASFKAGAPFATYFGAGGANRPPILLADGVRAFERTPLPDAPLIARTYGWILPVEPTAVHDWDLAKLNDRLDRAQQVLERRSDIFTIAAPTGTIQTIRSTSRVAAERLLILGGDAAVLLLGFAVLAATRLRRNYGDLRRRMTWAGARRSQVMLVAATEVAGITLVASAVGWIAGAGAGVVLAHHLGSPGWLVVTHSLFKTRTLIIALGLALVTAAAMLTALRADGVTVGGLRITVADTAAIGALATVLLALARGKADASSLSQNGGTGLVLLLLPALVLFVLAVVAARLLSPTLRIFERLARRAPPSVRVALLSLARSPGEVVLTVVFFVLSVGIAVFAVSYRATLANGEMEQARFAVPAPFVLQEDLTKLITVQQASLPKDYSATPVLRDSGFVSGTKGTDFTLLALPARSLSKIGGWRTDFSSHSPAQLSALIRPKGRQSLDGVQLSGDTLTIPFTLSGDRVGISAVVENKRGDFTRLGLGEHSAGSYRPTVRLPVAARLGKLVALQLSFPTIASFVAGHRSAETSLSVNDASTGTLRLDPRFKGWFGPAGVTVDGLRFHFVVNNAADAVIRPREPSEGELVPVIVSPAVAKAAGPGGVVALHAANHIIQAQIVGTTRFFPSVTGDVVVADLSTWLASANTLEPGVAAPSELWSSSAPPASVPLLVLSQRSAEAQLRADPIARGAITLLLVTAVLALALAAVGLLLAVVGDLRDERGALHDLSAQGASPAHLRRHVLLRSAVIGILGVAGGIGAGAVVGALVVAVVTVTAAAADALPPLALFFDWGLIAAMLLVLAITAAGPAVIAAWRAL